MAKKTAKTSGKKTAKAAKTTGKRAAAKKVKKVAKKVARTTVAKAVKKAARKVAKRTVAKAAAKPARKVARKTAVKPKAAAKPKARKRLPRKPPAPAPVSERPPLIESAVPPPQVEQPVPAPAPVVDVAPAAAPAPEPAEPPEKRERGPRFYEPDDLPSAPRAGAEGPFFEDDRRDRPIYEEETHEDESTGEVEGLFSHEEDDFDDEEGAAEEDEEDENPGLLGRPPPRASAGLMPVKRGKAARRSAPDVGRSAPDFELLDEQGRIHSLAAYRGRRVVLYFYPKDDTPGCTREACGFRDTLGEFDTRNAVVLGISPDSSASHAGFARKYGLTFALLADEGHAVAERYGVWGEQSVPGGGQRPGILRTTFVIDEAGRIAQVFRQVKPEGHEQEVLSWLDRN
jgi:peroxiredoxin Q/BCP